MSMHRQQPIFKQQLVNLKKFNKQKRQFSVVLTQQAKIEGKIDETQGKFVNMLQQYYSNVIVTSISKQLNFLNKCTKVSKYLILRTARYFTAVQIQSAVIDRNSHSQSISQNVCWKLIEKLVQQSRKQQKFFKCIKSNTTQILFEQVNNKYILEKNQYKYYEN